MNNNINTASMLRVGAILDGKYRIERYLSSGGFGNTYVAINEFGEQVAIKEFFLRGINQREANNTTVSVSNTENRAQFDQQRDKFKKEAMRLRGLLSPHIVKVQAFFEQNGTSYYVMDYIDGESLAERLRRTGQPLTEAEVLDILNQVLEALDEVHNSQPPLYHLDLKPGNIMADRHGQVLLIDFGSSKQSDGHGGVTVTAATFTREYAPLELIEGRLDKIGPWTDFYALGATIYRLLTNQTPPLYSDIQDEGTTAFHWPATVTQPMRDLTQWMMTPNRTHRPQSVAEVNNKLSVIGIEQAEANETNADCTNVQENTFIETSRSQKIVSVKEVASKENSTSTNCVEDEDNIVTTEDKESLDDTQHANESSLRGLLIPVLIGMSLFALVTCLILWYANVDNQSGFDNISDNTCENVAIKENDELNNIDTLEASQNGSNFNIQPKRDRVVKDAFPGKRQSDKNPNEEIVYKSVDQPPSFPGGDAALMRYIASQIRYPSMAHENNIQGKVILQFVVEKDGHVGDVKVVRSVDNDLDSEAVRVCKSLPKFTPGRQDGQPVRVWYTIPINFKLR